MCGIAGMVAAPGAVIDPAALAAAAAVLARRGPDDVGFLGIDDAGRVRAGRDPEVARGTRIALVHRRLAVLDRSQAGWQPMSRPDRGLHLVFNGEIYNFRLLRAELERLGHPIRSSGDTEVLLAALAEWGEAALDRLIGMWAIALVDQPRRRILLSRDPFGIKPLVVATVAGGVAFASGLRALLALTGLQPRADRQTVYDFLRYGLSEHGERSFVDSVRHLPGGHVLEVDLDRPRVGSPRPFWRLGECERIDIGFDEAARRLRELFLDNVALHLESDVPVGTALSGGIDSSAIVAAMRAVGGAGVELHAVSFAATEPALDESCHARAAAGAAGAVRHEVRVRPEELLDDLDGLVEAQEEPFASTSIWAQLRVFRRASQEGLTVMLDGQGADELFAGYHLFVPARAVSLLRRGHPAEAAGLLARARLLPGLGSAELARGLGFHLLPESWHRAARLLAGRPFVPRWMEARWFADADVGISPLHRARGPDALHDLLRSAMGRTSLPMLLRFEDRSSMACSVESRVPFLTPEMARFALSLPEEYLVDRTGTGKVVLRAAMRGLVPDSILDRRDKLGFATPERLWLGALRPWVESVLAGDALRSIGALRAERALAEWRAILDGRRPFGWHVWRWISLVRWAERFGVDFAA